MRSTREKPKILLFFHHCLDTTRRVCRVCCVSLPTIRTVSYTRRKFELMKGILNDFLKLLSGDKYNPGFQQRRYKNKPQLRDRQDTRPTENSIHAAYIAQENRRILKKLQYQVIKKVRPAFVSNCTCVKYGEYCPKLQITVARCQPDETMCCF